MNRTTTNWKRLGSGRAQPRRRAAVLILVVALLGLLFVAGAAFLGSVAFEARSVSSEKAVREDLSVVNAAEAQVLLLLNQAWLGDNGLPYDNDLTRSSAVGTAWQIDQLYDVYGEVPGQHPLVASIEPIPRPPFGPSGGSFLYPGSTELGLARAGRPWNWWETATPPASPPPALVPDGLGKQRLPAEFTTVDDTDRNTDGLIDGTRDADGDGIADSLPEALPEDLFPLEVRRETAERLRQADYNLPVPPVGTQAYTNDDLIWAWRIIPHSGLASVSGSHNSILEQVIGPGYTSLGASVYPAASEEPALRNRGFLLPRNRTPSLLVDTDLPDELRDRLLWNGILRWWPMDRADATAQYVDWTTWMDPTSTNPDIRHLLTTISHDDNLLRNGMVSESYDPEFIAGSRSPGDSSYYGGTAAPPEPLRAISMYPSDASGTDAAHDRENTDPDAIPTEFRGSRGFSRDYTTPGAGPFDPRIGRLKLSLPSLDPEDLVDNEFSGSHTVNRPTQRELYTVRDAFMLMLRNVMDLNGDGTSSDAVELFAQDDQAAQLAANLWDFVDDATDGRNSSDAGRTHHQMTRIDSASGKAYYGFEKQPFITELFYMYEDGVAGDTTIDSEASCIELFNPYPVALDLTRYRLVMDGTPVVPALPPSIPPGGYLVFVDDPDGITGVTGQNGVIGFTTGSRAVELLRRYDTLPHDPEAGVKWVVVDRFKIDSTAAYCEPTTWSGIFGNGQDDGQTLRSSLQRYIAPVPPPLFGTPWNVQWLTCVVPYYGDMPGGHTLGAQNSYLPAAPWGPVHALTADAGNVAGAFPTTGCLLLVMRYANEQAPGPDGALGTADDVWTPANDRLREDPNLVALYGGGASQRVSPDNGHMPLLGGEVAQPNPTGPGPSVNGLALNIPWGQLVFDYFTALPLSNRYDSALAYDAADPATAMPTVDQNGLRVHGRISINTAPWKVLSGVPRFSAGQLPVYRDLGGDATFPQIADDPARNPDILGQPLAKTIVAYRERREIDDGGGNTTGDFSGRPDPGFLTLGELLFASGGADEYSFDNNLPTDYLQGAARLIALSDWVTTRGHVFTIYGQIRGTGTRAWTDSTAVRIQETVDRLPSMFEGGAPQRIGRRVVGPYHDARSD